MTNEEKAIQVATDSQGHIQSFAHMSALEMALWKDEQFAEQKQALIDKACKWLKSRRVGIITTIALAS